LLSPEEALSNWGIEKNIFPCSDQGLINQTWLVNDPPEYVLQWVNPIFHHSIHDDIWAIAQHIKSKGIVFPDLIPLKNGDLCLPEKQGTWRLLEFIPGRTIHKVSTSEIAGAAGALVGKFHASLLDFEHHWIAPRRDIHNTPERMKDLEDALKNATGHPLEKEATLLGVSILKAWDNWDGSMEQPLRVCHGDLKISNLRFDSFKDVGVCLIDLDTLGPQTLSVEMGDAWRSWCNPAGESNPDAVHFNLGAFRCSAKSWLKAIPMLESWEKETLVCGIERICLELSSRFCTDSLNNSYFKEDRQKYPKVGRHNLNRARSQYKLAQSVLQHRLQCEQIIKE